jgi:hypothetical protein
MNHADIGDKLIAWADGVLPELQGTYSHAPDRKDQPFPDIAAELIEIGYTEAPAADVPDIQQIQQARVHQVSRWELILVVDPDPADEADTTLKDFTGRMAAAALADRTLGGRVTQIGKDFSFSFRPAFVEFDDGSRGRAATMNLAVADLVS